MWAVKARLELEHVAPPRVPTIYEACHGDSRVRVVGARLEVERVAQPRIPKRIWGVLVLFSASSLSISANSAAQVEHESVERTKMFLATLGDKATLGLGGMNVTLLY